SVLTVTAKEITCGILTCWRLAEEKDISKKLDLNIDMAKVCRAFNIPARFHEWCWLLSEHRKKAIGMPPTRDVERWKQYGPDLDDQLGERDESSIEIPKKRKDAPKLFKDEVATSRARDMSLLRKKLRLPYVVINSSLKEFPSAKKTQ
ncbi:unnamed protein product, partial [Prunus brigantina]